MFSLLALNRYYYIENRIDVYEYEKNMRICNVLDCGRNGAYDDHPKYLDCHTGHKRAFALWI